MEKRKNVEIRRKKAGAKIFRSVKLLRGCLEFWGSKATK